MLRMWLSKLIPEFFQKCQAVNSFIPHLDIQAVKKLLNRCSSVGQSVENNFKQVLYLSALLKAMIFLL